jgi:hypothetical protein
MSTNVERPVLSVALTSEGATLSMNVDPNRDSSSRLSKVSNRSSSYNGASEARQKLPSAKTTFMQTSFMQKITSE